MSGEQSYADLLTQPELLADVLHRMGLSDGSAPAQVERLTGGVSSSIFRVDVGDARYCMKQALPKLKVEKDWWAPVGRVFAEIAWLRAAHEIVPGHVPRVLGTDDACGAFAMEFLSAAEYDNWKAALLRGAVDVALAAQVGDVLGRIHHATAGDVDVARRFATGAHFFALRLEPYLVEAARRHPDLSVELIGLIYQTQHHSFVLVHGDVSPKNILVGKNGPVLLDAECAWFGDPAFDLAFLSTHLILKSAHLPSHAGAYLRALEGTLEGYRGHVSWEPVDLLFERIATLVPGLLLARIDGKSPVEYLDEATREQVRRFAREALGTPAASPASLLRRWQRARPDADER
ncbi:MAG: phosphotransferase [Proteobacteria bacterium]|nr:phosphotransferase [Burkholderiales bacterium]